ncbi:hypothetical protein MMC07_003061 [Pseudocyphellaria aurata]|nr:hypothetical protein [Pseudocyphellaria aurata]
MDAQIAEARPGSVARAKARLGLLRIQILPFFEATCRTLHLGRSQSIIVQIFRIFEFLRDRPERSTVSQFFQNEERHQYYVDLEHPTAFEFSRFLGSRPQSEIETRVRGIFDSYEELESYEEFISELRRRQSETVFGLAFLSVATFMSALRGWQSESTLCPKFGTREEFMSEFDYFEDFILALLRGHQSETVYLPGLTYSDAFKCDLVLFEDFMFGLRRRHNAVFSYNYLNGIHGGNAYESPRSEGENIRRVDSLLASLPAVENATIPEDDQSCPICRERYNDTTPSTAAIISEGEPENEPALRLGCNHVLGKSCLKS